jgi:hypothetical protein
VESGAVEGCTTTILVRSTGHLTDCQATRHTGLPHGPALRGALLAVALAAAPERVSRGNFPCDRRTGTPRGSERHRLGSLFAGLGAVQGNHGSKPCARKACTRHRAVRRSLACSKILAIVTGRRWCELLPRLTAHHAVPVRPVPQLPRRLADPASRRAPRNGAARRSAAAAAIFGRGVAKKN